MTAWYVMVEGVDVNFRRTQFTNRAEAVAHQRTWRAMGYAASMGRVPVVPQSVRADGERHLTVIEGGRGGCVPSAAPAAKGL